VLATFGALVLPVAAAQADAAWTGASTSSAWSDPTNWSDATIPTGSTGTLSFPSLGTCGTCYTSHNDLSGISATRLVLGNTSGHYAISGNSITVGSGGISDTPGGGAGDNITARIALAGSQTWDIGPSSGYNSLTLQGGITGSSSAAVTMSIHAGDLFVDSDMEAGPVTKSGPGGLHIGGKPGSDQPGSVNGANGQPLTVNGGSLIANPGSTSGQLNMNSGLLLLGTNQNNNGTTTLDVSGDATLAPSTTTSTFINNNGSTPGTDFSQLSASGDVTVGGTLVIGQGPSNNDGTGPCVALRAGDVATIVKASGTLAGTFANAPDGATMTMASSCQGAPPKLQINYTPDSVTATVLGDTTTKLATPSPSTASTNQTVTLTATVTATSAPKGTVAFAANASTISGCASQPLTTNGSSGTATCTASFPADSSPASLTAAFNPAGGSRQDPSISAPQSLIVTPAGTAAALSASSTSPIARTRVTYTATVTPGVTGASQPTGSVAFLDGGAPISACSAQPLTPGSPSSTATCTVTYPAAGSHAITATYTGDANFTGSSSQRATVTVQAPGGGGGSPLPSSGSGTHRLVLSRVAQSHRRWRERRAHPARAVRSLPVGTRLTFHLSSKARVTFTFIQMLPGRRARNRCVAPGKAGRGARACHRRRRHGRLIRSVSAGTHHLRFDGRIGHTMLPSGNYALVVAAEATSGARSRTVTLHFTIVA
jgi:hypothetical protein